MATARIKSSTRILTEVSAIWCRQLQTKRFAYFIHKLLDAAVNRVMSERLYCLVLYTAYCMIPHIA